MKIQNSIKKLTKPKGKLSYKQLADKLDVSQRSIYYWADGTTEPPWSVGERIIKMGKVKK